ncbi:MAG: hypothetical protein KAH22_12115 [Thiotrichaceae bacterium]|nr:hypothetical protein [Thiotrichaceae bacterium]
MLHIALHFIVPAFIAGLWFKDNFWKTYLLMMSTMLVDIDHLLALPIYDPLRCSIGFHPLHRAVPILVYIGLVFIPKVRFIGLGLVIHMILDATDCIS